MDFENQQLIKLTYSIFSDVPSAPEPPRVNEVTETACTVNWKAPESDGGSQITGY